MSVRSLARRAVINTAIAAGLDTAKRRRTRWKIGGTGSSLVQVVNLHETPKRFAETLRRQLEWANRHFRFIDFPTLKAWWSSSEQHATDDDRPALLFTFDDGYATQYEVAAPILDAFGARGLFFVCPEYCQSHGDAARNFYQQRIYPHECTEEVPPEEWAPMTPEQVADLASRGHTIGNHTLSHTQLHRTAADRLTAEISGSADLLENWTGSPVEAFAWTFSWDAINAEAWRAVLSQHRYCFSPCVGTTDLDADRAVLIWRTNVEAHYTPAEYRFMYSGLANLTWATRRRRLTRLLEEAERENSAP